MKNKQESDARIEATQILKSVDRRGNKLPPKDKNILDWTASELKAYVLSETAGMGAVKKMKWAKQLQERIKDEKAKRKK